ncbi:MAG: hypothetical protein K2N56_00540 [Oscillospiraceae bacterium]|nr:hypothetical protein [Oscillospiraceae bacterium]
MKKIFAVIPAAVLAVGALTGITASACSSKHNSSAYRQPNTAVWNYNTTVNTQRRSLHYYHDADHNGVCDCAIGGIGGICLNNGLCSSYYYGWGNFIDYNGDGVCDSCAAGTCYQHGYHHSGNFIDNDHNGICDDHAGGVCLPNGLCSGGYYCGYNNFADVNNDGICDSCAAGSCAQHGYHHNTVNNSGAVTANGHHQTGCHGCKY